MINYAETVAFWSQQVLADLSLQVFCWDAGRLCSFSLDQNNKDPHPR